MFMSKFPVHYAMNDIPYLNWCLTSFIYIWYRSYLWMGILTLLSYALILQPHDLKMKNLHDNPPYISQPALIIIYVLVLAKLIPCHKYFCLVMLQRK